VVDSIDGVDEDRSVVYFSASREDPTQKHLYAAPIEACTTSSCSIVRLTDKVGWHSAVVCPKAGLYVDSVSSVEQIPAMRIHKLPELDFALAGDAAADDVPLLIPGDMVRQVNDGVDFSGRLQEMLPALPPPVFETIPADDGTPLHCVLYKPDEAEFGPGPYPTVVAVYGGPHVQRVVNTWSTRVDLRCQRMRQNGIFVLKCDNRGSSRRGLQFEGAIKGDMGNLEVIDQATAVRYFANNCTTGSTVPPVDLKRVGMIGWSYGGYMSAMSICRAPDLFRCAVAGAPVTHWDGYDTHYTERYMGLPQENLTGYQASSVMEHVPSMGDNKLLLIHGLIDENVHFRHTARLINALVEHRKLYDLILFPCERHSPHALNGRVYLEDRVDAFFRTHLCVLAREDAPVESAPAASTVTAAVPVPVVEASPSIKEGDIKTVVVEKAPEKIAAHL